MKYAIATLCFCCIIVAVAAQISHEKLPTETTPEEIPKQIPDETPFFRQEEETNIPTDEPLLLNPFNENENADLSIEAPEQNEPSNFIQEALVQDGMFEKQRTKDRHVLAYDDIREADILWSKRIWREINTFEKMNLPFAYPKMPFVNILLDILSKNESAKIFSDDDFTIEASLNEVMGRLGNRETITVYNPVTEEYEEKIIENEFNPEEITKFRLKEDWVFDEEASRMVVRIIGIAPILDVYDDNGLKRGEQALFWAYYPSFRPSLAAYEVFNPYNDAQRLTWEDMMEVRYFSSSIYKESNVRDMRIKDYMASGVDILMESEAIKQKLFEYEHDLWSY